LDSRPRRKANNFHDSLLGVMSAANAGEGDLHLFCVLFYDGHSLVIWVSYTGVINLGRC
jgi:hypothetical protein